MRATHRIVIEVVGGATTRAAAMDCVMIANRLGMDLSDMRFIHNERRFKVELVTVEEVKTENR